MQKNFNIISPIISGLKDNNFLTHTENSSSLDLIKEIIQKTNDLRDQTIVIRLPTNVITDTYFLESFAQNIKLLINCGVKLFIIHDYTDHIDNVVNYFNNNQHDAKKFHIGFNKLQLIEMVLSGYINKLIVTALCKQGCNAIGISGKDGNLIKARQSTFLYKKSLNNEVLDIGSVSEPVMISPEILLSLEEHDMISVVSPIACDDNGKTHLLDVSLTAAIIATAVAADHLILAYEDSSLQSVSVKPSNIKEIQNILKKSENFSLAEVKSGLVESVTNTISNSADNICFMSSTNPNFILNNIFSLNLLKK